MGDTGTTDTASTARPAHPTGWASFEAAEPAFAVLVRERFGGYTHHALATLRKDGSPRLSGIEADFRAGELWLGMMPGSRKALDLRRDPRFALLANPGEGTTMGGGDVRVSGRAVEITDRPTLEWYAGEVGMPMPFHVFLVEPTEVVRTAVEGDDLVLTAWTPARGTRTIRRGNDESPPREG
ncbi:pyridoxamine 5'-phosphate oxidase family protein [Streptomyces sp. NPDC048659]|uniref:pyridoxamine 5'-phosphate oxidase family protein n=1 Tax=Streptomyces sp. NPDC048659 TaxID=3155489 RepID=UPI0034204CAE